MKKQKFIWETKEQEAMRAKTRHQVLQLQSRSGFKNPKDYVDFWLYEMHQAIRLDIIRYEEMNRLGFPVPYDPIDSETYKFHDPENLEHPHLLKPKINFYEFRRNSRKAS